VQTTVQQLSDAEDQLAQLQVEHEEALKRTEQELHDLRDRCAVLEAEQQAEIDACATMRHSMVDAPLARKAYLSGKTEGQRESIAAHAKIERLSHALEGAEKNALTANIQLLELKVNVSASALLILTCLQVVLASVSPVCTVSCSDVIAFCQYRASTIRFSKTK
jgi:hypothetical protein